MWILKIVVSLFSILAIAHGAPASWGNDEPTTPLETETTPQIFPPEDLSPILEFDIESSDLRMLEIKKAAKKLNIKFLSGTSFTDNSPDPSTALTNLQKLGISIYNEFKIASSIIA